jgi:hypothetical protein
MTSYDDWLEQPFQEAEARLDAIEYRTDELCEVGGDWDAQDPDNFINAIADGCLDAHKTELADILATGQGYTRMGEMLWSAVCEYCREQAEHQATCEIDEGIKS